MLEPITLITGTRKGIGLHLAKKYAMRGHQVIGCSRNEIDWQHDNYSHFCLDISNEQQVLRMFSDIRKNHGQLDNLINNAGIASMNHSLLTPLATVHKVLNTNVVGTFLFCREAAKLMKTKRSGRIVNFTTVAVPLKLEGESVYVASKAAVQSLTEVLAKEYAKFGVTVNAVGPGPVDTDLIRAVPEDKIDRLIRCQAITRQGSFDDITNVIDFYLKRESSFVTGQTIFLGGI